MEVSNCLKKFKLLFDYIFEGKVVLNDNSKEKLLKFLEDRSYASPGRSLLDTPSFSDLVFNTLENISKASTSVKVFIVEVITLLFKNELQFTKMQMQWYQVSCTKYCIVENLNTPVTNSRLQLACIKLATVQIAHCSGLRLLLDHKVWEHVLSPNILELPINISKASFNLVSQLIQKLNEFEMETEMTELLQFVLKPILESEYLTVEVIDLEKDKALAHKICPSLNALMTILRDTENVADNHIVRILKSNFLIEHSFCSISKVTRATNLLCLVNELHFRFYYSMFRHMLFGNKINEFCNKILILYHNCILNCIRKRDIRAITDFCVKCTIFWSYFEKTYKDTFTFPLKFERNGRQLELSNQLMLHLVGPLLKYAHQPGDQPNESQEFIEKFLTKIGKSIAEHLISSAYLYRPLLEETDLERVTIETLKETFRLKGHLTSSQAGFYFQGLFHLLDMYILSDGAGGLILNDNPIKSPTDVRILALVVEGLRMLLKEHYISWYENVEIVCLQERLMNLLKQNILESKQLVQVLDLIDICVRKFLSPNMTLLVETQQDSTLTEIGAVMKTYMHHEDWEVRDSALNLLLSCTDISFIKYIPLQKVISENNLIIFAAKVALTDTEYYAQCTALKCLAVATKIDCWRDVLLDNPHIYLQLVYTLKNNPEGMVRREAANVLTNVYMNQKVTPSFQSTLYKVMMAAALHDLHWEVQLTALQFWKHAINNQLTYRGMIDGIFPTVTFSKEKRKIIMLNDEEILKQLTSIMRDLASIGCLTVLYKCMNEVNNIEIMEKAYGMANKLIEILDKYRFGASTDYTIRYEVSATVKQNVDEMEIDLSNSEKDMDKRDKVIDSILNTHQIDLIINLHDNYIKTKSDDIEEDNRLYDLQKEMIQPNEFYRIFKETDYFTIINNRKNWSAETYSSLDVLLDEILDV